jgi:prepilin-type N-terminal cleavage/methylation domain-containing protein
MWAAGDHQAGVTLLEALVVIAVVAMIAAIIAPNIETSLNLLSLRQSASVFQADLRVARATALRTGNKVTVKKRPDGHGYDWIGGTRQFPQAVSVSMSNPVTFMADGSLIPATIAVASGTRRIPLVINSTTGAVTAGGK